jgi:hypothetical protein
VTLRGQFHRVYDRRWLALLGIAYAAAVGMQVVELAGGRARVQYAAGMYAWERAPADARAPSHQQGVPFRWTRERAYLLEPVEGSVLHIPLYLARPDIGASPVVVVDIRLGGLSVDRIELTRNGWHQRVYVLRDLLGEARWRAIERARTRATADPARERPPTLWIEFDVRPTFVPAAVGGLTDNRTLGIGVGEIAWSDR